MATNIRASDRGADPGNSRGHRVDKTSPSGSSANSVTHAGTRCKYLPHTRWRTESFEEANVGCHTPGSEERADSWKLSTSLPTDSRAPLAQKADPLPERTVVRLGTWRAETGLRTTRLADPWPLFPHTVFVFFGWCRPDSSTPIHWRQVSIVRRMIE